MKASKLEILGAWLGIWTPPRDVEVPPVPWRKVGYVALGVLAVAAAVAVFVAPAIDEEKDRSAAQTQRELAERATARRARIDEMQQPRFGRIPASTSRDGAVERVETAIGVDARRRFSEKATTAACTPVPGADTAAAKVAFACFSATTKIVSAGEQEGARGSLGYPYRAVVDFDARRFAFCRANPRPGEAAVGDPRKAVPLPAACLLER